MQNQEASALGADSLNESEFGHLIRLDGGEIDTTVRPCSSEWRRAIKRALAETEGGNGLHVPAEMDPIDWDAH